MPFGHKQDECMWFKVFSQLSFGFVILFSGGVAGVYYVWKYDKGEDIKQEIYSLEEEQNKVKKSIEDLETELTNLQNMDKTMSLIGDEINKFLRFIPNTVNASMILNHLNEKARSSGVELENIVNQSSSEKKEFYEKLKVSVTVRGLFTQILIFLSKLTGLTEIITVENFNMEHLSRDKGQREVRMKMDIYGYRYIAPIIAKQDSTKSKTEVSP